MNKTVQKLVYQYLDNTYKLELSTLIDYKVMLRTENKTVSIATMYDDVRDMFNLHPYNCGQYFESWIDSAALKLNNDTVDELYDNYETARTKPIPPLDTIKLTILSDNIVNRNSHIKKNCSFPYMPTHIMINE